MTGKKMYVGKMRFLVLAALFVFTISPMAFAASYYVDYAGGNDSNSGTSSAAPFKRCPGDASYAGSKRLASGDVVYFKKGITYGGMITTQSSGVSYTVTGWGSGDATINGSGQSACFNVNHSNITIDGGSGKNLVLTGSVNHAAIWNWANGNLSGSAFKNLKILNAGNTSSLEGIGIKIGGNSYAYTNYEISNNTITNAYSAGIKISGSGTNNIDIHHNNLQGNGRLPNERCQVNLSSNAGAGVQNVKFHDNTVSNGGTLANGLNCNNANNHIYNNVFSGNPGHGISLNPGYNGNYTGATRVYNNTISNNKGGYGIIVGTTNSSRPALIYNNLMINNGSYEINFTSGGAGNGVYNNTLYRSVAGHGIRVQSGATGNTFENNVISVTGGYTIYDSTGSLTENYNNLFRRDGSSIIVWRGSIYQTLGAYSSASGQGRNSISRDPLFADTTACRLSTSSPCLNAGLNLSSLFTLDKDGNKRPTGAWDIGAYETAGGTNTTTPTTPTTSASSFAVRAGSIAAITAADGTVYATDSAFSGGSTAIFAATGISGTSDPYLYRAERFGNFSYSVPLVNGNYNLTLKFAEMYWTNPAQRVFSVIAQGSTIISNLDLVAKVGPKVAYDVTVPVTVTNGTLKIDFVTQIDNAKVSAIVVKPR